MFCLCSNAILRTATDQITNDTGDHMSNEKQKTENNTAVSTLRAGIRAGAIGLSGQTDFTETLLNDSETTAKKH